MVLSDEIRVIKGIGEKKAKLFAKLGIETVEDLVRYYPFRYEDRKTYTKLEEIFESKKVFSSGIVLSISETSPKPKMSLTKIRVGSELRQATLTFYNQPYLGRTYRVGEHIQFYGTCQCSEKRLEFSSPIVEAYGKDRFTNGIYPVYSVIQGLTNNEIVKAVSTALEEINDVMDFFPSYLLEKRKLAPLDFAIRNIHFPKHISELKAARYRLIYEEFFLLQMSLLSLRKHRESASAYRMRFPEDELERFQQNLPFSLTAAQQRVFRELADDMAREVPMQRLVQGDVGSGKTILAWLCCYLCFLNGFQTVLMAPTEVLAKQHYEGALKLFENTGLKAAFLTGSVSRKQKKEIYSDIEEGRVDLVIGTHAVIQEEVRFHKLGLAITDEQHRFGVKQRNRLAGSYDIGPHILVMTATPIPRTLTLVVQGDLDVSVIDELPKGRKPIVTKVMENKKRSVAYQLCLEELKKGRQAYIVCPLILESEALDLRSAQELYESLKNGIFRDYRVGLLHGKMKPAEKDEIMKEYQSGKTQVLVSTTVIEVGINVPNASCMIIENAERFGLSQLHQLRGRVGRGAEQSYCSLIYKGYNEVLLERMKVMSQTNDGFVIAEKDLELRGPGEVLGLKQHGLAELKLADFFKHQKVLLQSKRDVEEVLEERSDISLVEREILEKKMQEIVDKKMREVAMN